MTFHFFPKKGVLRKSGKVWNSSILVACNVTDKYLIFQIAQNCG